MPAGLRWVEARRTGWQEAPLHRWLRSPDGRRRVCVRADCRERRCRPAAGSVREPARPRPGRRRRAAARRGPWALSSGRAGEPRRTSLSSSGHEERLPGKNVRPWRPGRNAWPFRRGPAGDATTPLGLVEAPVWSMQTRRAGSNAGCASSQAGRRCQTSGRCCPAACAVVLKAEPMAISSRQSVLGATIEVCR